MKRLLPLLPLLVVTACLPGDDSSSLVASATPSSSSTKLPTLASGDQRALRLWVDSLSLQVSRLRELPLLRPVEASWVTRENLPALLDSLEGASQDTSSFTYDQFSYAMGYTSALGQLESANSDFEGSEILGFYIPGTDHLWIVADATSDQDALKSTIAHELVHALQDQHFELRQEVATSLDGAAAHRILIEGDATYTELLYSYGNPSIQWLNANASFGTMQSTREYIESDSSLSRMPLISTLPTLLPYFKGPGLVHYLRKFGWPLVDSMLRNPPGSTHNCLTNHLARTRAEIIEFDPNHSFPTMEALGGWTALGSDRIGEVMVNTLLLSRYSENGLSISPSIQPNMEGWNGDRVWIWRKDDQYAVGMILDLKTFANAAEFQQRWLNANPKKSGRSARSNRSGLTFYATWTTAEDTVAGAILSDLANTGWSNVPGRVAAIALPTFPKPPIVSPPRPR